MVDGSQERSVYGTELAAVNHSCTICAGHRCTVSCVLCLSSQRGIEIIQGDYSSAMHALYISIHFQELFVII